MNAPRTARRRLLLVGLDGLDGSLLHPAIDAGLLPAFADLATRGAMGTLSAGGVAEPAVAWTTLATGVLPEQHGVLDATRFDAVSGELLPVGSRSRRTHALWNLASREGLRSIVVGWPASHPADPVRGAFVSDRFFEVSARFGEPWPILERSLHPASLESELAELRLHPDELGAAEIAPFVPALAEIDQDRDRRLAIVMEALAATVSRHAVATHLLSSMDWSLAAVRYPLADALARWFLPFRSPRIDGVADRDARIYGGVVDAALRLLDGMLASLRSLAGDATVLVGSPFGMRCVPGRGMPTGDVGGPVVLRHQHGFVMLAGEGIAADRLLHGAAAIDLVPTALALLGLPVGEDLPGRVLREAFASPPEPRSITSWEALDGDFGRVEGEESVADPDAESLVRQLVDLGYLDRSVSSERSEQDQRLREDRHLALSHLDAQRWSDAIAPLGRIVAARPIDGGCILLLAVCHLIDGDLARCRDLAERAVRIEGCEGRARMLLAAIAMRERRLDDAVSQLGRAEATGERGLAEKLAYAHLQLQRFEDADRFIAIAFAENPDSPAASIVQALLHLERREDQAAAEAALRATGLVFQWPEAHAVLGVALGRLGHLPEAVLALDRSIAQRPTILAHRALAEILERSGWDPELVRRHRETAEAIARSSIARSDGASA